MVPPAHALTRVCVVTVGGCSALDGCIYIQHPQLLMVPRKQRYVDTVWYSDAHAIETCASCICIALCA